PEADGRVVEAIRKNRGRVGTAVAVAILEQPDPVVLLAVLGKLLAQILPIHGHPVVNRAGREVILEPVHMLAVVGEPFMGAVWSTATEPPGLAEAEGARIGNQRLGGVELEPESRGHPDGAESLLRLRRGPRYGRTVRRRRAQPIRRDHGASVRGRGEECPGEE